QQNGLKMGTMKYKFLLCLQIVMEGKINGGEGGIRTRLYSKSPFHHIFHHINSSLSYHQTLLTSSTFSCPSFIFLMPKRGITASIVIYPIYTT
ncbi:MAG: hypothetical protein KKE91_03295, partial [Candidatus Omnitrophica bacterium]|nr:hypothetical protein [Candidatus Omnitrophota bacterium]